jgi:WD40 repeat protein
MDHVSFLLDLSRPDNPLLQKFEDHSQVSTFPHVWLYRHLRSPVVTQGDPLLSADNYQLMHFQTLSNASLPPRYVVRTLWSPSGKFFVTASYDKRVCVYREKADGSGLYELVQKLDFAGVVEALTFTKGSSCTYTCTSRR